MSGPWWRALSALLLALVGAGAAAAHTRSESYSTWTIDGRLVRVSIAIRDAEAARLSPDGGRPDDRAILAYFARRMGVTMGGEPCPPSIRPRMALAAAGFRRAELGFDCPRGADMALRYDGFFDIVPTHLGLAQIRFADGGFAEQLFTKGDQSLDLRRSRGGELADAGFLRFVQMGVMHIFTGVDHMSFLLGLVLISRKLRDLLFVVTGFTIGHSMTLALAVTGIVRPHGEFIDALVALTIALIGIENIVVALRRPVGAALATGGALLLMAVLRLAGIGVLPPMLLLGAALFTGCYLLVSGQLRDAGRLRLVVTMVFGLIHGFGFAADLLENRLPTEKLAEILVGFNLGVEIGQISVVLAITGLVAAARRLRVATPQPITVEVVAPVLIGLGTYWFVQRSFV